MCLPTMKTFSALKTLPYYSNLALTIRATAHHSESSDQMISLRRSLLGPRQEEGIGKDGKGKGRTYIRLYFVNVPFVFLFTYAFPNTQMILHICIKGNFQRT
jgi:hypothetical protein